MDSAQHAPQAHGPRTGDVGTAILDAHRDEIQKAFDSGASAGDMAKKYVVTRNTVIGWASRRKISLNRLNKGGDPNWKAQRPGRGKDRQLRLKRRGPKIARLPSEVTGNKPAVELISLTSSKFPTPYNGVGIPYVEASTGACQRPLWGDDVSVGNVCGHRVKEGSRYCPECHSVLWSTPAKPVRAGHRSTNSRLDFYKHVDFA